MEVDGKGSLNLITSARVLAAVAEVRVGPAIPPVMPLDRHGPRNGTGGVGSPVNPHALL
jgi:hypothetical protein